MGKTANNGEHLTAVDLFSGGGGLTVGLRRAGFDVIAAVEIEKNAISTYRANHPQVEIMEEDIRNVAGKSLLELSPSGKIDLMSGCPPCQGFSTLTNKHKRKDPRNELIHEMGRLIRETKPRAVMMENVPGLALKGKRHLKNFLGLLKKMGYHHDWRTVQIADYGIPQNRKRIVLLAGSGFKIPFPESTHGQTPSDGKKPWNTVRNAIYGMPKPKTLREASDQGGPKTFGWHIVRDISDINMERLKHTKPGERRTSIPNEYRPACHKELEKGFINVYGRMSWDDIAPTITGGCATLSKGRFGHPDENRTISVREAAMLQTFPKDYVIDTPYIGHACNIIGNALPCDFAEIFATLCANAIRNDCLTG